MAFVFEGLVGATLTLTILYFLLFVYTGKRLIWLQSNSSSGLNTRKLFVMTCMLTSALRVMSFGSMAMLDLGRVDFEVESDDVSGTGDFFEKSSLVLFNFPDFCCISAYVLLLVIWAETYLKSRRHWYSTMRFRKAWMLGYFIFNIILYASQLTIYSLLLLPSVDKYYETTLMYLTLSAFNLVLPVLWIALYLYLAIVVSRLCLPLLYIGRYFIELSLWCSLVLWVPFFHGDGQVPSADIVTTGSGLDLCSTWMGVDCSHDGTTWMAGRSQSISPVLFSCTGK